MKTNNNINYVIIQLVQWKLICDDFIDIVSN